MADEIGKAHRTESLANYSFKEQVAIALADVAFYLAVLVVGRTIRWQVEGMDRLDAVQSSGKIPILCLWHDRLFAGTYFLRGRGIVVITSQSRDGEYIARFLKRFGYATVRGSSTRGGMRALVEMVRLMRRGLPMAFTVDGPRGPRHRAKMGAVILAKKTGNPMVPFTVECDRFWTVKSWDRLQIPKPFTRARFAVGHPIYVESHAGDEMIDAKRSELERSLNELASGYRVVL